MFKLFPQFKTYINVVIHVITLIKILAVFHIVNKSDRKIETLR